LSPPSAPAELEPELRPSLVQSAAPEQQAIPRASLEYPPSPRAGTGGGATESLHQASPDLSHASLPGTTTAIGNTIGEIQNAIQSIVKVDSDNESEVGIAQDTRARLATQARLANEQRDRQVTNGEVSGLVYSDDSDDEEDEGRKAAPNKAGRMALAQTQPGANTIHVDQQRNPPVTTDSLMRSLSPALPLPSTPPLEQNKRVSVIPAKSAVTWTVEEVVEWSRAKGFDETIGQKFEGEPGDQQC
jgi:hypothetical protein